jgi:hypothetical protein
MKNEKIRSTFCSKKIRTKWEKFAHSLITVLIVVDLETRKHRQKKKTLWNAIVRDFKQCEQGILALSSPLVKSWNTYISLKKTCLVHP